MRNLINRLCNPAVICTVGGIFLMLFGVAAGFYCHDADEAPGYYRVISLIYVGLQLVSMGLLLRVGDVLDAILKACKSDPVEDVIVCNTPGSQV